MVIRRSIVFCAALALMVAGLSSHAQPASSSENPLVSAFPDNADIRVKLFSSLIGAPRELALAYGEKLLQSASGPVLARAVKRTDDFIVEFRNGWDGQFSATTRGTCLVQRNNAKGNYTLQSRIFLQDDVTCYLRLYPNPRDGSTLADVVLYGALLKKGMGVEGMLAQVLVRPFPKIVETARRGFDWNLVFPAVKGEAAALFASDLRGADPSSRAASVAEALDGALSLESLASALPGAVELGDPAAFPAGFSADRSEMGTKVAYAEFPRYAAGKGLPQAALRAAIYLDALGSPNSVYALYGENLRALAAPAFDESGRFGIALFWGGREGSWDELFGDRKEGSVRVLRLPADSP